ncbi:MarR family winged helix-turn-helix transcriptional regulator [Desulfovermiculus halophilus]|jgi:DNA-binding MarR family transcriptional regulator|uniref:MarR family winged helix-turn-helix transcriptional regulator n=1 Tax=Desulfovermiculus halophilus TaxID=339722 RepID=UPI000684BF7D|nr:MarR family winged helix-turn-helix transcriptional regulator [Desulfovermiculus halophilus]
MHQEDAALRYQAHHLQNLLQAMLKCCEQRLDREQHLFGLPCSEINCLLLFRDRRYVTLTQVGRELGVAKSRATALIDALVGKGLAERNPDPHDARIKMITLTRQGDRKLKAVVSYQDTIHEHVLRKFRPEERDQLLTCLEKLKYGMELVREEMGEGA